MNTDRWDRLQELFHQAVDLVEEERERFVEAACTDDAEMKSRLAAMLTAEKAPAGGTLEEAIGTAADQLAGGLARGDRVGPYRVVRELGRGGMGTVYLAERIQGDFEQRVALKVMGGVIASPGAVDRFLAERRILAQLSHPNIARLLDGGTTPQGSPWFAMEHVDGERIEAWCDGRRLAVRDRLEIFLTVCDAVRYAHGRLIVHRDLKPSNILVTADGSPKLLDFGLAKLLEPEAPGQVMTRHGELPMTPEYASPEQVRGEPVTTATDVYQLGLLLHELLTGRRAHRLSSHEPREIERVVCDSEVSTPSSAVLGDPGEGGASAAAVASARRLSPDALRRRLRGDLDTIVLMAMRREPERRYASVEQLAGDVRCHLDGRPVIAHRDSLLYRARKLVVRRAGLLSAAALVAVVLLAGLIGTTVQARRARQQARRAAEVTEFLTMLLEDADPDRSQGREVTVREVLDRAARSIEVELEGQPQVQATMQVLIGRVYGQLGLYEEAEAQLEGALERRRRLFGDSDPEVAEALDRLARARLDRGRTDEAEQLALEALTTRQALLGDDHPAVGESLVTLAKAKFVQGDADRGRELLDRGIVLLDEDPEEHGGQLADALHTGARIELQEGELERAEDLVRREIGIRRAAGTRTRGLALALDTLASVLSIRGQPEQLEESEAAYLEAIEIERELLGDNHPVVANLLTNLAGTRARRGDFAGGEEAFLAAYDSMREALGPDHPEMGYLLNNFAVFYYRMGRMDEAIDYYNRALELRVRVLGADHPLVGTTRAYLGLAQHKAGNPGAEATYRTALRELLASRGPDNPYVGNLHADLGLLLAEQGRYREAEPELRTALEILRPIFGEEDQRTDSARAGLGFARCGLGRPADADPLLRASREWREGRYPEGHWRRTELDLYDAECMVAAGRRADAARRIESVRDSLEGTDSPNPTLGRLAGRLASEVGAGS
ncbi:MAG: serine/threonine-protein kinase [Acidobacteriota bacterium]|jgi:serine/threonine-protein kinase